MFTAAEGATLDRWNTTPENRLLLVLLAEVFVIAARALIGLGYGTDEVPGLLVARITNLAGCDRADTEDLEEFEQVVGIVAKQIVRNVTSPTA